MITAGENTLGALDAGRRRTVSARDLSKLWQVEVTDAERNVNVTTQRRPQILATTVKRQLDTNDRMLRHRRLTRFSSHSRWRLMRSRSRRDNTAFGHSRRSQRDE